jgi:hypothetical protein
MSSGLAMMSIQPPIQWVFGALSLGVKLLDADYPDCEVFLALKSTSRQIVGY